MPLTVAPNNYDAWLDYQNNAHETEVPQDLFSPIENLQKIPDAATRDLAEAMLKITLSHQIMHNLPAAALKSRETIASEN
ncbi:MAG: hypothetical protein ABIR24_05070 [Verrucomicrobiota bacterium]